MIDGKRVKDEVITTEVLVNDQNGNKLLEVKKHIICSVCGYANDITSSLCKMCSNYLEKEKNND